jgi:tetratricopeptide (TPR) repeat protein
MAKVSLRAYNREIEAMIDRGHLDEAVAHCQHILKIYPKHLETYRLLGKAYLEAKRHNEAADIFLRVLNAEPSDFVAHVGMSIIRDEQNKLDDAIWHMERAYEVQSANPAIQDELRRLYGRRDGIQPPRIRMTRGALAHMYMRGELFPQAISECRSILAEDQGRTDMQTVLAKAYYRSGQKKDAADAASSVIKRFPFCLDANLILAELLSVDRPESAQTYRQRVIELDPYAAQAEGSMFLAKEVSDAAVSIEHLDWSGQPVGLSADWAAERAIGLKSGIGGTEEQPDWLKESFPAEPSSPLSAPTFESAPGDSSMPARSSEENIPDFLRAAGWGVSTGAFDESKSSGMFEEEPAAQPIARGDLPDWVKAMAPPDALQPAEETEEEIPDWINKIGTESFPVASTGASSEPQPDWLSGLSESAPVSDDQADWMKDFGAQPQAASTAEEQPDWLRSFGEEERPAAQPSDEQPDWLKALGEEHPSAAPQPTEEQLEWLRGMGKETTTPPVPSSTIETGRLGTSEEERDDSFAWLENLAAKQGATEGLLTKPEERREEEPEWVKQAKNLSQPPGQTLGEISQPPDRVPTPGKSEQEIDDALAWFESLAARQGATEGLLTKPEERREEEPEWVKQAKSSSAGQPSIPQAQVEPVPEADETPSESEMTVSSQPADKTEGPGRSGQEIDDALAWFESLAVRQGATEGLLTKPEERREEEPEWIKQVKQVGAEEQPSKHIEFTPEPVPDTDVSSWLKSLDEESVEPHVVAAEEDVPAWLNSLDTAEETPVAADDLPVWMRDMSEAETPVEEAVIPEEKTAIPTVPQVPAAAPEELPDWLTDLKEDEQASPILPVSDDLPAWMRDATGELVVEPTKIEPTRATDWMPVTGDEPLSQPSPAAPPPAAKSTPEPGVVSEREKAKKVSPRKEKAKPAASLEPYQEPVTIKGTGMLTMPGDPILGLARNELSRSNIPGALDAYGKLIKKGRYLEEVIFDLREALYRYPVEVSIWQTLGDAYMRANQLQDALDAYTKAEELLR